MILGILMSKEVKIAILETQVERLLEKQKELTERVRANEKVVAAIGLFGSVAVAFIGAGYFAPKAEAHMGHDIPTWPTAGEMIEAIREEEARKKEDGADGEQKEEGGAGAVDAAPPVNEDMALALLQSRENTYQGSRENTQMSR